jgi:hypothetical protein
LIASKSRDEQLSDVQRVLAARTSSRKEMSLVGSQAAFARARSEYLNGMLRWNPVQLNSTLHFKLCGSYPESSVSLTFKLRQGGLPVSCRSKVDPTAYRQRAGVPPKLSQTAASCLKKCVGEILQKYTTAPIQCRTEIGPLLSLLDLRFGRLEHLAAELSDLETRYPANISFSSAQLSFEVEFSKCVATFEVKATYPFEPTTVRIDVLEGKVDERKLKRHLIKQVKPGYGYLTRLCDCMEKHLLK